MLAQVRYLRSVQKNTVRRKAGCVFSSAGPDLCLCLRVMRPTGGASSSQDPLCRALAGAPSHPPAACGRSRRGANTAAVGKRKDRMRQHPAPFSGHRKAARSDNPEGEAAVNDSPADCQSRRTDRRIFTAVKMQDRRFKSYPRDHIGWM